VYGARVVRIGVVGVAALLLAGCGGSHEAARWLVFGTATGKGPHAAATALNSVRGPSEIQARVTTAPPQTVHVTYAMNCTAGFAAGKQAGSFGGRTPLTHDLPVTEKHAGSCDAAVTATLARRGSIRLVLAAR
jgi:hypothetical protein